VDGIIATVAGTGKPGFSGDGGKATEAQLSHPWQLTADSAGNLFIADWSNYRVRKVTPDGIITTLAGIGKKPYSGEGGPATAAALRGPFGFAVDAMGTCSSLIPAPSERTGSAITNASSRSWASPRPVCSRGCRFPSRSCRKIDDCRSRSREERGRLRTR
jgi:hypothetical protein